MVRAVTPAARVAAAIDLLGRILAGAPAERVLTTWARANRYAGSGDRAAIRDHVFDALRCRRSYGWLGGSDSGRGLMIGALLASGTDPNTLFTGEKFAPEPLDADERRHAQRATLADAPRAVRLDCPDWLLPAFDAALGRHSDAVLASLRRRAPVFLRVNLRKADRDAAGAALRAEGIETRPHPLSKTALEVTANARRLARAAAYRDGRVELQDAASQAVVEALPLQGRASVLDYCAGGGGKALAIAARTGARVHAHDGDPRRLKDLPARARRAGADIAVHASEGLRGKAFDLVLCDVPCSGSGAWRRSPDAKWRLNPERLARLTATQDAILDRARGHVRATGVLALVTCSLLRCENEQRVAAFLSRHDGWRLAFQRRLSPRDGGDGFFVALLERENV